MSVMMKRVFCIAIMACMVFGLSGAEGMTVWEENAADEAFCLRRAQYPETVPSDGEHLDAWWAAYERRMGAEIPGKDVFVRFCCGSASALAQDGGNLVYSPVGLCFALRALARLTEGESRSQILAALGCDSLEALDARMDAIFLSIYEDDGESACVPGLSLWLDKSLSAAPGVLEALSDGYKASVFSGEMGDAGYDEALRAWVNRLTNGLMTGTAGEMRFTPMTVMSLLSTLYLRAAWVAPFLESATAPAVFHATAGDVETDFLL